MLAFLAEHAGEAGIVYCLSRKKVDAIAAWLAKSGFRALPYHAGMDADERRANQLAFLREDAVIVVATIAFGMGIDKPDVRFVVHLDLPKSIESYYQETGRAGRDGEPADAWMLYGLSDVVQQRRMIDMGEADEQFKRVARGKLEALLGLCETPTCRRGRLLAYFGETRDDGLSLRQLRQLPVAAGDLGCERARADGAFRHLPDAAALRRRVPDRRAARQCERHASSSAATRTCRSSASAATSPNRNGAACSARWSRCGWVEVDTEGYGTLRLTDAARPVLRGEVPALLRRTVDSAGKRSKRRPQGGSRRRRPGRRSPAACSSA